MYAQLNNTHSYTETNFLCSYGVAEAVFIKSRSMNLYIGYLQTGLLTNAWHWCQWWLLSGNGKELSVSMFRKEGMDFDLCRRKVHGGIFLHWSQNNNESDSIYKEIEIAGPIVFCALISDLKPTAWNKLSCSVATEHNRQCNLLIIFYALEILPYSARIFCFHVYFMILIKSSSTKPQQFTMMYGHYFILFFCQDKPHEWCDNKCCIRTHKWLRFLLCRQFWCFKINLC